MIIGGAFLIGDDTDDGVAGVITRALDVRGDDCYARREFDAAERYYDQVIERGHDTTNEIVWSSVIGAASGKAKVMSVRRQDDAALAFIDLWLKETVERFPAGPGHFGRLLTARISILVADSRWVELVVVADEVLERFGAADDADVRWAVAQGLIEKATAIERLGRPLDERLAAYEAIVERAEDVLPVIGWKLAVHNRPAAWVAHQKLLRATLLSQLDRSEESAHAYEQLIREFEGSDDAEIQLLIAAARAALESDDE